jgi:hypothetical protein
LSRRSYIILAFQGQNIAKLAALTAGVNWIYSDSVPDEIAIPPPLSVLKEYQWDTNHQWAEPLAQKVLNQIDPERNILTPEQQRRVMACPDREAISALLKANLNNVLDPDLKQAHDVLGNLGKHGLNPARMILTIRFFTLAQLMLNLDSARTLLDDKKKVSIKDRLAAQKLMNEAASEFSHVCNLIEKLAKKMELLKEAPPKPEAKPPPKPRAAGVAPDLE